MLELARAIAYDNGVQSIETVDGVIIVGYFIPYKSLLNLYLENGFTSKDVPKRHLEIWKKLDLVRGYISDALIVIIPRSSDYKEISQLVDAKKNSSFDVVVTLPKGVGA